MRPTYSQRWFLIFSKEGTGMEIYLSQLSLDDLRRLNDACPLPVNDPSNPAREFNWQIGDELNRRIRDRFRGKDRQ